MSEAARRVLVLDDGELQELVGVLEEMDVDHVRLRGGDIGEDLEPPLSLLVATPRRAGAVVPGSPAGAAPGRPLRIISVSEDSNAMRAMLRRQGFHLLVRLPAHREVWRLLIKRALYQGDERRREERIHLGSHVGVDAAEDAAQAAKAVLVDISNRGFRLLLDAELPERCRIDVLVPPDAADGVPLPLAGTVLRCRPAAPGHWSVAVLYGDALTADVRERLAILLNSLSHGDDPAPAPPAELTALPACPSPSLPGLTLDDETDPAVPTHLEVELSKPESERRQRPRGPFLETVEARAQDRSIVLMGRDLSTGGMRIERLPELEVGDRFEIVIYAPGRSQPFHVKSEVVRDDGEAGLGLRFHEVEGDVARGLEKLVACLPDVESLQNGEAEGLGTVITEIVPEGKGA